MSILDCLAQHAKTLRDKKLFTFLKDDGTESGSLSIEQLDQSTFELAKYLKQRFPQQRFAVLCYGSNLDFIVAFMACLAAGIIAVPMPLPRKEMDWRRINAVLSDVDCNLVFTDGLREQAQAFFDENQVQVCNIDHALVNRLPEINTILPKINEEDIAFLQYTSGSTGSPKGVIVTHANIIDNQKAMSYGIGNDVNSVGVSWLPFFHDMGLIGCILQPVYLGFHMVLMSPASFLQEPSRWLRAIHHYRATVSGAPSFAYQLCVDRVNHPETFDLSCWTSAFCGAERVNASTYQSFIDKFSTANFKASCFLPCYGLAESTLYISGHHTSDAPPIKRLDTKSLSQGHAKLADSKANQNNCIELVSNGVSVQNCETIIVDPSSGDELDTQDVGEIWVASPSVAKGYFHKPELTQEVFAAHTSDGRGPYLRTGDLGFKDQSKHLYITGRLKEVVILRGANYYPQDLEQVACENIRGVSKTTCAAFAVTHESGEHLVIVMEVARTALRNFDIENNTLKVKSNLTKHFGVAVHDVVFIKPASISKTTSGKLQRFRIKQQYVNSELSLIKQGKDSSFSANNPAVLTSLSQVDGTLGVNHLSAVKCIVDFITKRSGKSESSVNLSCTAAESGLDSLAFFQLQQALQQSLNLHLEYEQFFSDLTLLELAKQVVSSTSANRVAPVIQPNDSFELSPNQISLWLAQQQSSSEGAYTITLPLLIRGEVDPEALNIKLRHIQQKHILLSCKLFSAGERFYWQHDNNLPSTFECTDAIEWSAEQLQQYVQDLACRGIDITREAGIQVSLAKLDGSSYLLTLQVHHIVSDLWSINQLMNELTAIPEEPLQAETSYALHVSERLRWLDSQACESAKIYWRKLLSEKASTITWPDMKFEANSPQDSLGKRQFFSLKDVSLSELKSKSCRLGVTSTHWLVACYALTVAHFSGEKHFRIGVPVSGRPDARYAESVGLFVNTICIVIDLHKTSSFDQLVIDIKEQLQNGIKHQWFPAYKAVQGSASQSLRFYECLFSLQLAPGSKLQSSALLGSPDETVQMGNWQINHFATHSIPVKDDLAWLVTDSAQHLNLAVESKNSALSHRTVESMVEFWQTVLVNSLSNHQCTLNKLSSLSGSLFQKSYLKGADLDGSADINWFSNIIAKGRGTSSSDVAIVHDNQQWTYEVLAKRSQAIAAQLYEQGVGQGDCIALFLPRIPELIASMLAVSLVGAHYVALDTGYPEKRNQKVLDKVQPKLVLTVEVLSEQSVLGHFPQMMVCAEHSGHDQILHTVLKAQDTAYFIFTSGSTGNPKGVTITHGGLNKLLHWASTEYSQEDFKQVAATTSVCFDLSTFEIFATLCSGGSVHLLSDALSLTHYDRSNELTLINTVPSAFSELLRQQCTFPALRVINLAGEPLSLSVARSVKDKYPQAKLYNLYGPSEDTTYSTYIELGGEESRMLVGRPLPNTRIYFLDENYQPVCRGAVGEIAIAGDGVSPGYFEERELTNASFLSLQHPLEESGKIYLTGDLGRISDEGELQLIGRKDRQVKLRGFRIELNEIESILQQDTSVRHAAVIVSELGSSKAALRAFICADITDLQEIKGYLQEHLPHYMQPATIENMPSLPYLPNGKVDYQALRSLPLTRYDFVAPTTEVQIQLRQIWARLLDLEEEKIGITDSFYALGGHSLLALGLIQSIDERFSCHLRPADLNQVQTIESLALKIERELNVQRLFQLSRDHEEPQEVESFEL
ncbi:amino acid adenylation domain-containing protein [Pseudoalteromonas piscicida]|uniref:amino acid adenylation domain-containing protein n=1 Tax=Pseudoalteromonas piscicida TaxID=43662 RepID=UPI0030998666